MKNGFGKIEPPYTEEEKKLITKRQSYMYFKDLYDFIEDSSPEAILWKIHEIIDGRRGYHSMYNSVCAEESIEFVLREKRNEK